MKTKLNRLIPHPRLSDEDLRRLGDQEGWTFFGEIARDDTAGRPRELIWKSADGATSAHLVYDTDTDIRYLALKGNSAAELAARLWQDPDWFYDRESILAAPAYARDSAQSIRAIYHIGVSAPPEFDDEFFEMFEGFMGHPDPEVRKATVAAMAYSDWPELANLAQRVRATDDDPGVRAAADAFLRYEEESG